MSVFSALYGAGSVIFSKLFVKLPVPSGNPQLPSYTIIVTGANTGLGFEACLHLSRLGVDKLIMGVRTIAKGEDAKRRVIKATGRPESSIEVWPIDMDSYDSIKSFATRASELSRLDGVLANAGVMTSNFSLSERNEKTLNVNVISTFLLYLLLLPKMRESGQNTGHSCHYVIPNSALHYVAPLAELDPNGPSIIDRLNDPHKSNMAGRYPLSKLLVLYAVREFAERTSSSGKGACIINTPNPSFCKSNLANESQGSRGFRIFEKLLARSSEEGSRVLVHGLLAGEESNGQYLSNCHVEV
ncbi:NAD(P)-binding protein [Daldinia eschscholtzii]|nr:NAD(P)-binding protein [Daldinia eschscholtzii]